MIPSHSSSASHSASNSDDPFLQLRLMRNQLDQGLKIPGGRSLDQFIPMIEQAATIYVAGSDDPGTAENPAHTFFVRIMSKPELTSLTQFFMKHAPGHCRMKLSLSRNKPELASGILEFLYSYSRTFRAMVQTKSSTSSSTSAAIGVASAAAAAASSLPRYGHSSSSSSNYSTGYFPQPSAAGIASSQYYMNYGGGGYLERPSPQQNFKQNASALSNGKHKVNMVATQNAIINYMVKDPKNSLFDAPDDPVKWEKENKLCAEECVARDIGDRDGECKVETESTAQILARCSQSTKYRIECLSLKCGATEGEAIRALALNGGNVHQAFNWLEDFIGERMEAQQIDIVASESEESAANLARRNREKESEEIEKTDVLEAGLFRHSILLQEVPQLRQFLQPDSIFTSSSSAVVDLSCRSVTIDLLKMERKAIQWYGTIAKAFSRESAVRLSKYTELLSDEIEAEIERWEEAMYSLGNQKGGTPSKMVEAYDREIAASKKRERERENDVELDDDNEMDRQEKRGKFISNSLSSSTSSSSSSSSSSNGAKVVEIDE